MFVQFFGILIFTEYKVAISNIQKEQKQSVDQLVLKKKADIMAYMYDISKFMHGKKTKIDGKIYDDALIYIEEGIRFSTISTFKSNKFSKLLHPKLKDKVVMATLSKQIHRMRFFFEDTNDHLRAPQRFITQIMVSLNSTLFDEGEYIVENGSEVEDLFFLY